MEYDFFLTILHFFPADMLLQNIVSLKEIISCHIEIYWDKSTFANQFLILEPLALEINAVILKIMWMNN